MRSAIVAKDGSSRIVYITQRKKAPGTVSVEMALVAPVLIFLLFGIIEMGLVFRDLIGINQVAREAARTASVGGTTTEMDDRIISSAYGINQSGLTKVYQYRTYSSGTWGDWTTLGNTTDSGKTLNDAASGAQVRVQLTYSHHLLFAGLFSRLVDNPANNSMNLHASLVVRRE